MTEPVIRARHLGCSFSVSASPFHAPIKLQAVSDVSFEVAAGETLAIVGESGSGKTTLARMLVMVQKPDSGVLEVDGVPIKPGDAASIDLLRARVQMVFQDPVASLNPRWTVRRILEEPLLIRGGSTTSRRLQAAYDAMERVGLRRDQALRYPHMFSGGQQQRIAIARALMLGPKILVADEPVSALDVSIRAQILNLLADIKETLGTAYIFISHDLGVVRHIADTVMVMYFGRVVECGPKNVIFSKPAHPYTRALIAATPLMNRDRAARSILSGELPSPLKPPIGCAFRSRCPQASRRCAEEQPPLRNEGQVHVACHHANI